jgi:hypothetical protein
MGQGQGRQLAREIDLGLIPFNGSNGLGLKGSLALFFGNLARSRGLPPLQTGQQQQGNGDDQAGHQPLGDPSLQSLAVCSLLFLFCCLPLPQSYTGGNEGLFSLT